MKITNNQDEMTYLQEFTENSVWHRVYCNFVPSSLFLSSFIFSYAPVVNFLTVVTHKLSPFCLFISLPLCS